MQSVGGTQHCLPFPTPVPTPDPESQDFKRLCPGTVRSESSPNSDHHPGLETTFLGQLSPRVTMDLMETLTVTKAWSVV